LFLPADVLTFRTVRRAIGGRISDRFYQVIQGAVL
jgi:hypothetical protein